MLTMISVPSVTRMSGAGTSSGREISPKAADLDHGSVLAFGPPLTNSRAQLQLDAVGPSLTGDTTVVVDDDLIDRFGWSVGS